MSLAPDTIAAVHVRVVSRSYVRAFRNPQVAFAQKHAVLVFVETRGGALGIGEAWCDGASPASVVRLIEDDLVPRVLGRPVSAPRAIHRSLAALDAMALKGASLLTAIGAIDAAVWDAYARSLDQPLHRLLGGARDRVAVYGSAGLYADGYTPEQLAADMAGAMAAGCCGVKIKVAGAPLSEDVERVAAVRGAIGDDARLMIDALFAPDVRRAIKLGDALRPYHLWFYEAPTHREDLDGWAEVRRATGLPLSGPEVAAGLAPFRAGLERGIYDHVQGDVAIAGGHSLVADVAALASAHHRPLTMHASGSAVSFAHNAVAAAAHGAGESVEYHLLHQALFETLWKAGWRIANGAVHLPDRPGIGIDLTPDESSLDHREV